MSVIKPDESQLKKEADLNLHKQKEDDERAKYIESLRTSRKFKKYVLSEIFEKVLEEVYSIDNIPLSDEPSKIGGLTTQYILARKGVKKIIDKFK